MIPARFEFDTTLFQIAFRVHDEDHGIRRVEWSLLLGELNFPAERESLSLQMNLRLGLYAHIARLVAECVQENRHHALGWPLHRRVRFTRSNIRFPFAENFNYDFAVTRHQTVPPH